MKEPGNIPASSPFPLDEYCERIGVTMPGNPGLEVLAELQQAQLESIPFENFDILLGRGIHLDSQAQLRKLLRDRRGGYCFELNGLFLRALRALGFEARPLLARVHLHGEPTGRSHQLSLVRLSGMDWLVDTGFGSRTPPCPLPYEADTVTQTKGGAYRLVEHELGRLLQVRDEGGWTDLYSIDSGLVVPMDIVYGNHYTSTHPDSHFRRMRIAVIRRGEQVVRLQDLSFRTGAGEATVEREIPDSPAYLELLEREFGIRLGVPYRALPPIRKDSAKD